MASLPHSLLTVAFEGNQNVLEVLQDIIKQSNNGPVLLVKLVLVFETKWHLVP
jgi:hypothetical protein